MLERFIFQHFVVRYLNFHKWDRNYRSHKAMLPCDNATILATSFESYCKASPLGDTDTRASGSNNKTATNFHWDCPRQRGRYGLRLCAESIKSGRGQLSVFVCVLHDTAINPFYLYKITSMSLWITFTVVVCTFSLSRITKEATPKYLFQYSSPYWTSSLQYLKIRFINIHLRSFQCLKDSVSEMGTRPRLPLQLPL